MAEGGRPLLRVDSLVSGYGKKEILRGVTMTVNSGEIVALIGHNGAGKSTLLKAIFGVLPIWKGGISFEGRPFESSTNPHHLLRRRMAYIPQGSRVFTGLSVRENLDIGALSLSNDAERDRGVERALEAFPALKERLTRNAGTLSGGEKQQLALANAMVIQPRMLLLDEPSLGLAPHMIHEAMDRIRQLNEAQGVTIIVVEQKVREILQVCHRVCALKLGVLTFDGAPDTLTSDAAKLREVFL